MIKEKLGDLKQRFLKSKFLVFILGLTIGIVWTSNYFQIKSFYLEYRKTFTYGVVVETEITKAKAYAMETKAGTLEGGSGSGTSSEIEGEVQSSQPELLPKLIKKYFPENYEEAIKIAKCESQLDPNKIGDTDKTYSENGRMYGDSIGLFQIRMFPDREAIGATRENLKDAEYNCQYARKIYDRVGWKAWLNCKNKLNLN